METEPLYHEVKCPKCKQIVDRVDNEYARHYVIATVVCTASRREIKEPEDPQVQVTHKKPI
jgi:phage FluMu protein Com